MQICEALRSYDGFTHSVYCTHSRVWSVAQELMSPLASFSETNSDVPGPVAAVACANYMDYAIQSDVTLRMWQGCSNNGTKPSPWTEDMAVIWQLYDMTVIWCYMTVVTKRCSGQSRAKPGKAGALKPRPLPWRGHPAPGTFTSRIASWILPCKHALTWFYLPRSS